VEKGTDSKVRATIIFPRDLYLEAKRLSGGKLSAWVASIVAKAIEEEKRKAILHALPESLRSQLLEKAGGSEEEAAELALRLLNLALEEKEEEEAAQEAIGYANRQEAAREKRGRARSPG
jgi:hypothetical protein